MAQLPAGMRNNNPGNIKYVGQKDAVGPSVNTDQGDPQAVYSSPEVGMAAMYRLLLKKYTSGKVTPDQIIAGNMGWTPGNHAAAANVARSMGIGPHDDIGLTDPGRAAKFMRALMLQEHGKASSAYSDDMIHTAIGQGGKGPTMAAQAEAKDYEPRLDTPSSAKPTASELPGPPATAMPGQFDLPDRNNGGFDIADLREALEDKMTPAEHLGAGMMDVKMPTGGFNYNVPPVQPAGLAQAQPAPMINPQAASAKREGLAAVMARLNAPAEAQAAQAAQAAMFAKALKGLG